MGGCFFFSNSLRSDTHPAESGHRQRHGRFEIIRTLLGQPADEAGGRRHHPLKNKQVWSLKENRKMHRKSLQLSLERERDGRRSRVTNRRLSLNAAGIQCGFWLPCRDLATLTEPLRAVDAELPSKAQFEDVGVKSVTRCWSLSRWTTLDVHSPMGTRSGDVLLRRRRQSAALCFTLSMVSLEGARTGSSLFCPRKISRSGEKAGSSKKTCYDIQVKV